MYIEFQNHQLNVHFLPRLIKGTYGRLLPSGIRIDNPLLATFWDFSFSQK